jgi:hypothetical protein
LNIALMLFCAVDVYAKQQSGSRPASPAAAAKPASAAAAAAVAPVVVDKSATSKLIVAETLAATAPSSPSRGAAGYVPYDQLKGLGKVSNAFKQIVAAY